MKLNELKDNPGAFSKKKRVGRGLGSGLGKTCGHGQKGQKSRSGVALNGFEGGQMPTQLRLAKRGFRSQSATRKCTEVVNLGRLQKAIDAEKLDVKKDINPESLEKAGLIRKASSYVRVLAGGAEKLKASLSVCVSYVSEGARQAVEKAGGSVQLEISEKK